MVCNSDYKHFTFTTCQLKINRNVSEKRKVLSFQQKKNNGQKKATQVTVSSWKSPCRLPTDAGEWILKDPFLECKKLAFEVTKHPGWCLIKGRINSVTSSQRNL